MTTFLICASIWYLVGIVSFVGAIYLDWDAFGEEFTVRDVLMVLFCSFFGIVVFFFLIKELLAETEYNYTWLDKVVYRKKSNGTECTSEYLPKTDQAVE
jgi:hypothetical protein